MTQNLEKLEKKKFEGAQNTYILYAIGAVAAFIPQDFISVFGFFCVIAGSIMMYYFKSLVEESDLVYASQASWLSRTFWIGSLVTFPIAALFNGALVAYFTNYDEIIIRGMNGGYGTDMMGMYNDVMALQNELAGTLFMISCLSYGPALIWWLLRCQKGWRALKKGTPEIS